MSRDWSSDEEVEERRQKIEDLIQDAYNIASNIKQGQQELEKEESQTSDLVDETEEDIQTEQSEINQSEQDRSDDELRKAIKDEFSIEKLLRKQEEMIEQQIEWTENQLRELDEVIQETKDAEKMIISTLREFKEKIVDRESGMEAALRTRDTSELRNQLNKLQDDFSELRAFAQTVKDLLVMQEELLYDVEEEAKANLKLENIINQVVAQELGVEESQVEELQVDAKKFHDEEAYEKAEEEEQTLKQIVSEAMKEENEEEKIINDLEQKMEESQVVLQGDEDIVEVLQELENHLDKFEQFMIGNRKDVNQRNLESDSIRSVVSADLVDAKFVKTAAMDLRKTRNQLRETEQKGRNIYQKAGDHYQDAKRLLGRAKNQAMETSEVDFSSKTSAASDIGEGTLSKIGKWSVWTIVAFIVVVLGVLINLTVL